ncbi:MAG: ATP-binding protein [Planctomycetota bacterium]|jgi:two-component system sensor histidine kinase PhoQ
MKSIKSRLTFVSMIVLVLFMILTAIALERAVVKRALQAEEDKLQVLIYSLLAAVDRNQTGLSITVSNDRLFESSLMTRDSGLYAMLYDGNKNEIWHSLSTGIRFPGVNEVALGDWEFNIQDFGQKAYFRLVFAIQWPDIKDRLRRYDVVVWKEATDYFRQLERFRQTLWAWLIVTTLLLLGLMYLVMMWSLRPLKIVGREIKAIEDRKQAGFERSYPKEITPLTENLNILLGREQYQQQRYRNAMDDLAHSLKTPLAVLNGISDAEKPNQVDLETLREQVDRMNQIVSYQLQKASNVASLQISKPIDLIQIITKVLAALGKVYQDKSVQIESNLPRTIMLRMDESDCLEVIGNLLDNAFKYCTGKVAISVTNLDNDEMQLSIADDGQGLKQQEVEKILNRGTRLDQTSEGQGIGLAVVADIVKSYKIQMKFERSMLGGLGIILIFKQSDTVSDG